MPWNLIIRDSAFRIGEGLLQGFWDQHVLHPAGLSQEAAKAYISQIEGHTTPASSLRGDKGRGKQGKDVVPFLPNHPSPHTDRSGGPPAWQQPAHWEQDQWSAPDPGSKKDWKKKGAKGDKGGKAGGGKGKKGKGKGKEKNGKKDTAKDWSTGDLSKEEKRAIEGQRWKAWMKQAGK